MGKMLLFLFTVFALMLSLTGVAFAEHDHYLVTLGNCVVDIAKGQTAISDSNHGGYHRFHFNVHLGTPGMKAFENPNNPVAVYKAGTGPGC